MTKAKNYISVGFFAFFGGALRAYLNIIWSLLGTFIVNIVGCFLLAFFTYFFINKKAPQWLTTGLMTGFVGAFTTFSSFHLDTLKQLQSPQSTTAWVYFFASIIIGFGLANLGMMVGKLAGRRVK
ncbi:CrcB family protein [Lactobacillus sp. PV037]|uniref:fluoride efflux transporter FluC n=1 Tax=unclassified Lactobacillus TaxID=2620435 RepID=UPI0022403125|nr:MULTISPECIES: CrcB family protein [unclassified Lactobacillus]QNQ82525.1 CrcB family protein [Lactobacillus sp. PV012]QNQ83359.1 CrcB family protein [Lactobacillus sp. PV037]